MLDKFFGSSSKEEIEELERRINEKDEKIRELKNRLDEIKEEKNKGVEREIERAKKAITEKQEVYKDLKEAKQRINTLKDKIRRLSESRREKREYTSVEILPRNKANSFIKNLSMYRSGSETLVTQYFSDPQDAKKRILKKTARKIDSDTGYVSLWSEYGLINCIISPPIPLEDEFYLGDRFKVDKLLSLYDSNLKIGFTFIQAGRSCVGLLNGEKLEELKIVKGLIKGRHSKGGFSQKRFERIRREQRQRHATKVKEKINEIINDIDFMILSGNKRIIKELRDAISINAPIIEKNVDVQEISRKNIGELIDKIWGCKLYIL